MASQLVMRLTDGCAPAQPERPQAGGVGLQPHVHEPPVGSPDAVRLHCRNARGRTTNMQSRHDSARGVRGYVQSPARAHESAPGNGRRELSRREPVRKELAPREADCRVSRERGERIHRCSEAAAGRTLRGRTTTVENARSGRTGAGIRFVNQARDARLTHSAGAKLLWPELRARAAPERSGARRARRSPADVPATPRCRRRPSRRCG